MLFFLRRPFFLFCCAIVVQQAIAVPKQYAFRIAFTDKTGAPPLSASPAWLSARSVAHRDSLGIALDSTDRPVSPAYVDSVLRITGGVLHNTSRWLNQCVVLLTDSSKMLLLSGKPFVRSTAWVGYFANGLHLRATQSTSGPASAKETGTSAYYGAAWAQTTMVNGDYLHDLGFRGEGQIIAVLDQGFDDLITNPGFDSLRGSGRLLETYDFVHNNTAFTSGSNHGSQALSTMAGLWPGTYVGAAPGAAYALYIVEDISITDALYELDNLVAGMERADSLGADVISCSQGYNDFVSPYLTSVTKAELDGHTTIVARAANLAVSKGMLYVSSSGNEAFLLTPSDADSALTVGSVNSDRTASGFSSPGPNSSGRVKPDVCLLGGSAAVFIGTGVTTTSGTSFSAPQAAGFAACLRQAFPRALPGRIRDAVSRSADRYSSPTPKLGYGIPDFKRVFNSLDANGPSAVVAPLIVSPNPFDATLSIRLPRASATAQVMLCDAIGREVRISVRNEGAVLIVSIPQGLPRGMYILRVIADGAVHTQKLTRY